MIISFLILAISCAIIYLSNFKTKRGIVLTSIFVPLSFLIITILLMSASKGQYYAGQRIAGSIIPIFLSGLLLYNNLNNKFKKNSTSPFFLVSLTGVFFVLSILEISLRI
jgi:hypothetical protein